MDSIDSRDRSLLMRGGEQGNMRWKKLCNPLSLIVIHTKPPTEWRENNITPSPLTLQIVCLVVPRQWCHSRRYFLNCTYNLAHPYPIMLLQFQYRHQASSNLKTLYIINKLSIHDLRHSVTIILVSWKMQNNQD